MPATASPEPAPRPGHRALRSGRVSLPGQLYLVTVVTADREPVFDDFDCACAAARHFASPAILARSRMLAWVLMPDHAHALIELGAGDSLSSAVARVKSSSARAVNAQRGTTGAMWERSFHDRALRRDEDMRAAARYLVANPLRAGLVEHIGDYPFWDAAWL